MSDQDDFDLAKLRELVAAHEKDSDYASRMEQHNKATAALVARRRKAITTVKVAAICAAIFTTGYSISINLSLFLAIPASLIAFLLIDKGGSRLVNYITIGRTRRKIQSRIMNSWRK